MAARSLVRVTKCEAVPEPRSGHRCCATSNHLIVYGGFNNEPDNKVFSEILCYNTTSKKWIVVPNSGDVRLESASCSMLLHEGELLVFGGSGFPFGFTNSNELSLFSLNTQKWSVLDSGESLNCPEPKYGQSMVMSVKERKLFVFSGTLGSQFVDEMHSFDLNEKSWHILKCTNMPEPRYRHEAVATADSFYVFGGSITGHAFGFDHTFRFSFASQEWEMLACRAGRDGNFPEPRTHHSCVLYKGNVYMVGGLTVNRKACDDVWKICLGDLSWHRMDITLPRPLFFHSAAVSPEGCMFIFGRVVNSIERTSDLYELWLDVPPLLKLCFNYILGSTCMGGCDKYQTLKKMGIPSILLDRMFDEIPAG